MTDSFTYDIIHKMAKWLIALFGLLLWEFRGAFQTYIFQDDFYLFSISKAASFKQFFSFFTPFKTYGFYRPLGIEVFYFLAGLFNNLILTRLLVFGIFFLGLFFLYKIWRSRLATLMYAISFVHVFQLYWLATFQEVAVFTFSVISTYFFLRKRLGLSTALFFCALLSREEAMLLPVLWLLLTGLKQWKRLVLLFSLAVTFFIIYQINFSQVAIRPEYAPHFNLRLVGNNVLWYGLWSLGLPNFLPDFWPSIFGFPTKELITTINNSRAWPYLIFLGSYLALLITAILSVWKKVWKVGLFCLVGFLIFILPMSVIIHKWMVRLTIPLVFVTFFEAYVIYKQRRILGITLVVLYLLYNFLAVPVHENSSTYRYESKVSRRTEKIIRENKEAITTGKIIYFSERQPGQNGWEGSQKLKLTLFDQWFINYFLPGSKVKVVYGYESPVIPAGSFIIESEEIL